ncbi:MAG: murein biosynthesis integral membrane protein MurJ [Patescibacteria group bacterium]|nr:MAG: murein biosynthesis integral membrane protein MurJ [Patescibacteria group bacterium]
MIGFVKKRLANLFGAAETVAGAAVVIASLSVVSRVLGVVRDRILAGSFGAGETLDIYYAAFRLPDLIFNILVLGALSAGFIPVFSKLLAHKQDKEAWRLSNNILNTMSVALLFICVIGVWLAPWITKLVAPGFTGEAADTVTSLTRIMFISPFLLGLSSIVGSVLQSYRRFFAYSLSPIFYNFGIIFGALYLVPQYGISGLAWGVAIGSAAHVLVQLPTFYRLGFAYRAIIDFKDKTMRSVFALMTPRVMALAVSQINLIVITAIASTMVSGSLSVFNLANNLQSFPVGIFGISFAIAAFPALSSTVGTSRFIYYFAKTLRQIMFFIIPVTVIMLSLRAQLVRLILGSGEFDWQATILTIDTLAFFSISLFAQAALPLVVRAFYARQDAKTPFYTALFSVLLNIFLAWWLAPSLGVAGLALAFSLSAIVQFLLLFIFLRHNLGGLDEKNIIMAILKYSVAALFAAVAIQAMKLLVWPIADMTRFWGVLLQGGAAGIFGLVVYLGVCSLLHVEEASELWSAVKRRLLSGKKPRTPADGQGEARGI